MDLLDCTVMPYAWGSRTAIAELTGRPSPTSAPEAELWMGAHPAAPSSLARGAERRTLDAVVAADPAAELGAAALEAFGPRLPFLLKVLAAAEPLSLQAHPTAEQARRGWEDEEARGVPRAAPHRNYKDASHKPELLCALTPFTALSGFRRLEQTLRLFDDLAVDALEPYLAPLRATRDAEGLRRTFELLLRAPADERPRIVDATVAACARPGPRFAAERALARRLVHLYPGDVGVVSVLFLELVALRPGQAIYLGAGNLHAYLEGTGVEIMASSDNVLRGGLTPKHVDVPELLRVLDFTGGPAAVLEPRALDGGEAVYETPAREFRLSRVDLAGELTRSVAGPEILLVTAGAAEGESGDGRKATLPRGAAAFVPAAARRWTLRGEGTVFRAATNAV